MRFGCLVYSELQDGLFHVTNNQEEDIRVSVPKAKLSFDSTAWDGGGYYCIICM